MQSMVESPTTDFAPTALVLARALHPRLGAESPLSLLPQELLDEIAGLAVDPPACRVVMIGEPGSGNSSLLARFAHNTFDPVWRRTIGIEFENIGVTVRRRVVELQVWDVTCRLRSDPCFEWEGPLGSADGVIITADVSDPNWERNCRQWHKELGWCCCPPGVPVVIACTKIDRRVATTREIVKVARDLGCVVHETSAMTGEGVTATFNHLAELIAQHRLALSLGDEITEMNAIPSP
eukprot:m51a1_g4372 putative member ras oncogene family (237) ;mRNA; f:312752-313691